jgi:hypothetical protein
MSKIASSHEMAMETRLLVENKFRVDNRTKKLFPRRRSQRRVREKNYAAIRFAGLLPDGMLLARATDVWRLYRLAAHDGGLELQDWLVATMLMARAGFPMIPCR